MTEHSIVKHYLDNNYRCVFWPAIGDLKGPREEGWPRKVYTLDDYQEGYRVGLITGVEVAPGKFLHDVDIDWAPGSLIAQLLLPPTGFVFGRASKKVSHCMYLLAVALPSFRFEDIDNTCLIEVRGTKADGSLGMQSMAPPSVWSKDGQRELLAFVASALPSHVEVELFKRRVGLAAIGLILAKNLGTHGFGHEARLAWAGFLLRAGITPDELITMGEAMSPYCNNLEVKDVRTVVESTAAALAHEGKRVKGGPALAKLLGQNGKKVIARINEWLGRGQDFIRSKDGVIVKDSQHNIRLAIELCNVELSYDVFAEKELIRDEGGARRPLEDAAQDNLWFRIDSEHKFRPTYMVFEKMLRQVAREHEFHPVRDYLDALVWDGTERINTWLKHYGGATDPHADSEKEDANYLETVSALTLMAAVARIYEPGCKYDEMLVLESPQGMNKSTALRALCPRDEWFLDDLPLNISTKELIERTLGKWLIEAGELAGKRKTEVRELKQMMSRQSDGPVRMAYAHKSVDRLRHFIWIGTTNDGSYLNDSTGARRFWPVTVTAFDVDALRRDRDQLWAEAVVRIKRGESIRMPERLWLDAGSEQERRRAEDPWESTLSEFIDTWEIGSDGKRRIPTEQLWLALRIIAMERRDGYGARRISEVMQRLGFERTKVYDPEDKKTKAGYIESVATFGRTPAPRVEL